MASRTGVRRWGVAVAVLAACASACGGKENRLDVFAAASLGTTFEALAQRFQADHPGLEVVINAAGSQTLAGQIEGGAPCDVVATADRTTAEKLFTGRHIEAPIDFAKNHLVVIAPKTNPAGLRSWEDLPKARTVALGADDVPVGRYARAFLAQAVKRAGVGFERTILIHVVSFELDVKHVLGRVARREVEAGIVYQTDARAAAADIVALPVPPELEPAITLPIAQTRQSEQRELGAEFIAFVRSEAGKAILAQAGFEPVP